MLRTAIDLLTWYAVLQLSSLAVFPILSLALPHAPDRGYGLAKALGIWFIGLLIWLLASLDLITVHRQSCTLVLAVILIFNLSLLEIRGAGVRALFAPLLKRILHIEIIFLCGFGLFLLAAAYHPEIFWGEKPMDFTFLNYFIRLTELPPDDPWLAGQQMNYYYLGTFLYAVLHKITGVDSAYGYNFAMGTIAASHLCAAFSLGLLITQRLWVGYLTAAFLTVASNLELIKIINFGTNDGSTPRDFNLFWATTRGLTFPAFAEFPLWSILFADLHAHVINLPLTVALLALSFVILKPSAAEGRLSVLAHRILFGSLLGSMFAINSWDFLAYSLYTVILLIFRLKSSDLTLSTAWIKLLGLLTNVCAIAVPAILTSLPYIISSTADSRLAFGFVLGSEFNSLVQVLGAMGQWILSLLVIMFLIWIHRTSLREIASNFQALIFSLLSSMAPLSFVLISFTYGTRNLPWGIAVVCSTLIFAAGLWRSCDKESPLKSQVWAYCFTAGLLISVAELFFIVDRMNTIFKFYHVIWTLLASATAVIVPDFIRHLRFNKSLIGNLGKLTCGTLVSLVISLSFLASAINIWIMSTHKKLPQFSRPTLNGMAYLDAIDAPDSGAISFIRREIDGIPVILEAHGPRYQNYTRYSMFTGLPTVLGWDYHVFQRGATLSTIEQRKRDIAIIYSSENTPYAYSLLEKYEVDIIVVGRLERETYKLYGNGLKKFAQNKELFRLVYKDEITKIYVPAYSKLWHTVPAFGSEIKK